MLEGELQNSRRLAKRLAKRLVYNKKEVDSLSASQEDYVSQFMFRYLKIEADIKAGKSVKNVNGYVNRCMVNEYRNVKAKQCEMERVKEPLDSDYPFSNLVQCSPNEQYEASVSLDYVNRALTVDEQGLLDSLIRENGSIKNAYNSWFTPSSASFRSFYRKVSVLRKKVSGLLKKENELAEWECAKFKQNLEVRV